MGLVVGFPFKPRGITFSRGSSPVSSSMKIVSCRLMFRLIQDAPVRVMLLLSCRFCRHAEGGLRCMAIYRRSVCAGTIFAGKCSPLAKSPRPLAAVEEPMALERSEQMETSTPNADSRNDSQTNQESSVAQAQGISESPKENGINLEELLL